MVGELGPGEAERETLRIERQHGRVPKLGAGEGRTFEIDYAIHVGEAEVKQAADRVKAVQGDRKAQVDAEPEKID